MSMDYFGVLNLEFFLKNCVEIVIVLLIIQMQLLFSLQQNYPWHC